MVGSTSTRFSILISILLFCADPTQSSLIYKWCNTPAAKSLRFARFCRRRRFSSLTQFGRDRVKRSGKIGRERGFADAPWTWHR